MSNEIRTVEARNVCPYYFFKGVKVAFFQDGNIVLITIIGDLRFYITCTILQK